MADANSIESSLKEKRVFKPDPGFVKRANVSPTAYKKMVREAEKGFEKFWARMAKEHVSWFSPWKKTLEWKPPFANTSPSSAPTRSPASSPHCGAWP